MRRCSFPIVTNLLICAAVSILLQLVFVTQANSVSTVRDSETIAIAAIFARTGFAAVHNRSLLETTKIAVAEVNSNGGVLGKKLDLIILDNNSTPIGAKKAALEAVELGVVGVVGAHWSSHSMAMAPTLQQAGIPMISPVSTHPDLTMDKEYIFRACFDDGDQGEAMARFAIETLGIQTAVILRNIDEVYCVNVADSFSISFTRQGGEVLDDASYRSQATDFSELVSDIKELQPDAVYIPGYVRDTALFMKQARRQGVNAVFLGGDGWDILERLVPNEVEGSYQTVHWHPDVGFPASSELQALYRQAYGMDLHYLAAPLAYDSIKLLVAAIEKAGVADPVKIRDALASLQEFSGATGVWSFDDQGNPVGKKVLVVTYTGGKIELVDFIDVQAQR